MNTNHRVGVITTIATVALAAATAAAAQTGAQQALAKALAPVSFSLESGMSAAEAQGTPISAKFEMEDNKLQLSVYTMKGAAFSEVVVDHATGKVVKTEPITAGEDLAAAKAQSAAMSKAKGSLRSAVEAAVKSHAGFRAVSAVPAMKAGQRVATIRLVKGTTFTTVSEKLD